MNHIRHTTVAGGFYPSDPVELNRMLNLFEERANNFCRSEITSNTHSPVAVIVPHAGYVYSGEMAMKGLMLAKKQNQNIRRIVLIAPSHRIGFQGVAIGTYDEMDTPLGMVRVDIERQNKLRKLADNRLLHVSDRALEAEHALEVELPMIRKIFDDIPVLPLVSGRIYPADAREISGVLNGYMDAETLFVVSSDFTHYGRNFDYLPFTDNVQFNLRKLDLKAAQIINSGDLTEFGTFLASTSATICGAAGIKLIMAILEKNGGGCGKTVDYSNSGELTGDFSHAVGYCSILLYREKKL